MWNHGGSGDDVQAAFPGHVVSVLMPASGYAEPFLRRLAGGQARELVVVPGAGSFGRQVTGGAVRIARALGIRAARLTRTRRWHDAANGTCSARAESRRTGNLVL